MTVDVSDRARGLAPRARVIGRIALWAVVAVLLFRGFGAIISPPETINSTSEMTGAGRVVGDRVAAVAVRFARDYFSDPQAVARTGRPTSDSRAVKTGRMVAQAEVAGARRIDADRVVVTVECELASGRVLSLAVPIRDTDGAASVLGAPYLIPPPIYGFEPERGSPATGPDAGEITKLVGRFLSVYAQASRPADLVYFVAPGSEVTPLGGFEMTGEPRVTQLDEGETTRTVIASVRLRDRASGVRYPLKYRLELVKRQRWFVADVQGTNR